MLLRFLSSLVLVNKKRSLVEIFSDPVRSQWNRWELRGLVMLSLTLQISLICTGNRRKYTAKRRIRIFIWCAYLLADWTATVALGLLVDRQGNSRKIQNEYGDLSLMAFWAPFLLIHLGGPDTITAYALADNELWLRHLLGLLVQTVAAIYITLLAWEDTLLSFLTIPMLLCGIIKYGERTWVLMSANREQLQKSFLGARVLGPSYAKFMADISLKEREGYNVTPHEVEDVKSFGGDPDNHKVPIHSVPDPDPDASILQIADYFFETLKFKLLLVDLVLSFHLRDISRSFFLNRGYETMFQVIEIELGFAYDVFYTKAPIIFTPFGLLVRLFTSSITLSVLISFIVSIDVGSHKHQFIDVVITWILLIGAILIELYAAIYLLSSDWANLWFIQHSSKIPFFGHSFQSAQIGKRWSSSMYQYSLLDSCLSQKSSTFYKIFKHTSFLKWLKNLQEKWMRFYQRKHVNVSTELKAFIFEHFRERSANPELGLQILLKSRGAVSLRTHGRYDMFKWAFDVEFDHSILIWHIATNLCYNLDIAIRDKDSSGEIVKQEWDNHMLYGKQLADYMLYIMIDCPFMMPMGIGMIKFQDTYSEALAFFEEESWQSKLDAYKKLGKVSTKIFPNVLRVDDRSESVLFEACKLAASLTEMNDPGMMWEMVGNVWVEILGYAAGQCKGLDHAQRLGKGGELVTHIWLLMAHLGITEHFKGQGHGRVKLVAT